MQQRLAFGSVDMAAKISKRLVIDASIARSSGGKEATYPTSVHCRDFLQAILDICHRVVMTPDIREEWNKHQSNFARTWLRTMVAKKKVEYRADIAADEELWNTIESITASEKNCEAMLKDFRLIEAALATDKTVISLDDTVRKLFDNAAVQVGELRNVVWVNPDKTEEEKPIDWLKDGAQAEKKRLLGNLPGE
jgi:hypothetical protein